MGVRIIRIRAVWGLYFGPLFRKQSHISNILGFGLRAQGLGFKVSGSGYRSINPKRNWNIIRTVCCVGLQKGNFKFHGLRLLLDLLYRVPQTDLNDIGNFMRAPYTSMRFARAMRPLEGLGL